MPEPAPQLAALPLDEQLRWLEGALERREDPRGLLLACAAVRDHAPLSWLCRALLERGWLSDAAQSRWLSELLLQQPDTAVDRVVVDLDRRIAAGLRARSGKAWAQGSEPSGAGP